MIIRAAPRIGEQLPVTGLGTWQTFDVGPGARLCAKLAGALA